LWREEFWHRRAEENAHNEVLAYLTMVLGAVFLVGGLLITITVTENPTWLFILPYQISSSRPAILALTLTTAGFGLILAGFVLALHYDHRRSRCLNQIEKTTKNQRRITPEEIREILKELDKEKEQDQLTP